MNNQSSSDQSPIEKLLSEQLARVEAPADFDQVTSLRLMLQQLPRASAPEHFEEEVLQRLAECRENRSRFRLRRLRTPRQWLAIGAGAAVVGGALYYFATQSSAPEQTPLPSYEPVPLIIQADSQVEQTLKPYKPELPERRKPDSVALPSTTPTKQITPGNPRHQDDE